MEEEQPLQWHPAFFASLQIEFEEEQEYLTFENEHQLGTKPKAIDVLIIKKVPERQIQKNIGRIFREHNIIEYKSPTDYLCVDDFYQVYAYAYFYKAEGKTVNQISINEITITFVCSGYPQSLVRHLQQKHRYHIERQAEGIYYISGDLLPMQILLTEELSEEQNLYLRSLTNKLQGGETPKKLLQTYQKHKDDKLYESFMNIVVQANKNRFGGIDMCKALEEIILENFDFIMKDKLEENEKKALELGEKRGLELGEKRGLELGEKRGLELGEKRGLELGEKRGREVGKLESLLTQIQKKCRNGKTPDTIAYELEEELSYIEKLYQLVIAEPNKSPLELVGLYVDKYHSQAFA